MIYVVTEEGVYRHRILGVFDSQQAAEDRAVMFAAAQDDYHDYQVSSCELNAPITDVEKICVYRRPNRREPPKRFPLLPQNGADK
jgi:hypothetical protein